MIKVIIFDMGGVVSRDIMPYIYEETGRKFNIDPKIVKEISRTLRIEWQKNKISDEEFYKQLAAILKISDVSSLKDVWDKTLAKYYSINYKIIEIIKKLKANGYTVALLSNSVNPHATYHRERKDFDIFSHEFLSFELGMRKPEKEIYEYVIKTMDVKFEECVFIDDMEHNLEPARELGMKTILFQSAEQLEEELRKLL